MDRFANFNTTFITIIFDQFFPVDSRLEFFTIRLVLLCSSGFGLIA